MIASERLKRLEALVSGATQELKAAAKEKNKLSQDNRALANENTRLKEEIKRLSVYPIKFRRLRERLEKLLGKLEKIK